MGVFSTILWFDGQDDARSAPLAYLGSHVVPDVDDGLRGGSFMLAEVPGHVLAVRAGVPVEKVGDVEFTCPALRVSVSSAGGDSVTVLLDADQVLVLRDALTQWLSGPVVP